MLKNSFLSEISNSMFTTIELFPFHLVFNLVTSSVFQNRLHLTFFIHIRNGCAVLNLLKPTGYVMHHQFNIQQLYALPTLYLCVLYLSENKQRLVPLTA